MEEEKSVVSQEPEQIEQEEAPEQATVFAFGPEAQVDAEPEADSPGEGAGEAEQMVGENGVDSQDPQKNIDAAIGREKRRIREKYKTDVAYRLGQLMVDDLMKQDSTLSREDAGKKAIENFNKAVSKRDGVAVSVLQDIQELKQAQMRDPEDEIDAIYQEVLAAKKPEGFDEGKAYSDPAFIEMLTGYNENGIQVSEPIPVKYAIQIYMANQRAANASKDVAEKVRAGKALPTSIKPQQRVSPRVDWTKVSDEDFLKEKERRKNYY